MSVSLATERTGGPPHGRHRAGPLQLAGLRRWYERTVALDGLSFTVEPGAVRRFATEEPSLSELFLQAVGP